MNFKKMNEEILKQLAGRYDKVVRYVEVDEKTFFVIPDPAAFGWFVPRSELYISTGKMGKVDAELMNQFFPSLVELTVPANEIKPTPYYIREVGKYFQRFEGKAKRGATRRVYIDERFLKWLNVDGVRFYQFPFPEKDLRKQPIVAVAERYNSKHETEKYPVMVILPAFLKDHIDAY